MKIKFFTLIFIFILSLTSTMFGQENSREFEMKEGDTTYVMKKYILCLLKKGPHRDQSKEEAEKIQAAHLAHMNDLAEKNIIAMAGPIEGNDSVQGIVIYNLGSIEEARENTSKDPAVQAGRLVMEFLPWWAAKGSKLP